jgi:hypothetical protein
VQWKNGSRGGRRGNERGFPANGSFRCHRDRRGRLEGHGGIWLIPRDRDSDRGGLVSYEEWSLRAGRPLGPFAVLLGLAASNYPVFGPSGKIRFAAAISRAF